VSQTRAGKWDSIRLRLEALRDELIDRIGCLRPQLKQMKQGGDVIDRRKAVVDAGTAAELLRLNARELNEVTEALLKLDAGEFGLCERCGEPIEAVRLDARPQARCCRSCQEQIETPRHSRATGFAALES